MLDLIYIASLLIGLGTLKFFTDWCNKQIEK